LLFLFLIFFDRIIISDTYTDQELCTTGDLHNNIWFWGAPPLLHGREADDKERFRSKVVNTSHT
jgi:hypothetical protein